MKRIIRKTYINDFYNRFNVQKNLLEFFQPFIHESNDYKKPDCNFGLKNLFAMSFKSW